MPDVRACTLNPPCEPGHGCQHAAGLAGASPAGEPAGVSRETFAAAEAEADALAADVDAELEHVADVIGRRVLEGLAGVLEPLRLSKHAAGRFADLYARGWHFQRQYIPGPSHDGLVIELRIDRDGVALALLDARSSAPLDPLWGGRLHA